MALNQKYNHNVHIALPAPEDIDSGQAVAIGAYRGVAQISASAGERVTIWLDGSYMLPVTGAAAVGDQLNLAEDGTLAVDGEGVPFGIANAEKTATEAAPLEVAPFGMVPAVPAGADN